MRRWRQIGDHDLRSFVKESEMEENFMEEQGREPFSSNGFLGGAENYPLSKAMVNHDQKRVKR